MSINWFEIIAQMVNFFILLFLLNKLFYKPVIKAMDARQERLAAEHDESERRMVEANELATAAQLQLAGMETTRQEILSQARAEAKEQKERLLEKSKTAAELRRDFLVQEVEEERERFLHNVRLVLGESAVRIAGRILTMVSREDLQERTFALFIEAVRSVDKTTVGEQAQPETDAPALYSSHKLSDDQKQTFEACLEELLGVSRAVTYEIDTTLVLGFELRFETLTVHKSVRKYLEETEATIKGSLEQSSR